MPHMETYVKSCVVVKNKFNSSSFVLFFTFCLLLILGGCGSKEVTSELAPAEEISSLIDDDALAEEEIIPEKVDLATLEHPSGFKVDDLPEDIFTDKEKEIFLKSSVLEEQLSKEQMHEVARFYQEFLVDKKEMIERFLGRSLAYREYIIATLEAHDMPKELASLPYIESGYNTTARSHAGATGLWQFMPKTGSAYGLKQDWWGDWRYDPYQATHAAIAYLKYLYKFFDGDWALAVSAYNAGEGKMRRALRASETTSLHELLLVNDELDEKTQLRVETIEYLPKFIAMSKIMHNIEELEIEPQIRTIDTVKAEIHTAIIKENTDLLALANALGMPWKEFHRYNPALATYISPANRFINIYIPQEKEELLSDALAKSYKEKGWKVYTVRKNDSFSKISENMDIPIEILREVNPIRTLKVGMKVLIPQRHDINPSLFPNSYRPTTHKVKRGDTLSEIAQTYNISLNELYRLNKGIKAKSLRPGMIIKLATPYRSSLTNGVYVVQSGDSLWSIAQANNIDTETVIKLNNLSNVQTIYPGQKLILSK